MNQEDIDKAFEGRWRIKGNFGQLNQNSATMSFDEFFEYIKDLCRDFFEAGILIGEGGEEKALSKGVQLTVRSNKFFATLNTPENVSKYGTQMLKDFFDYWTEPNRSKTKMRFELQQTFDISRRLARWARNNYNRYDRQPTTNPADRLADILVG